MKRLTNTATDSVFTQLAMFGEAPSTPAGLRYQPDLISELEEQSLVAQISALPLAPFQFGVHEASGG
jgi:hypothetical protein